MGFPIVDLTGTYFLVVPYIGYIILRQLYGLPYEKLVLAKSPICVDLDIVCIECRNNTAKE